MERRLTRSRSNVVVAGVCAGLGRYLGIDPVIVRVFFVLLALWTGVGVLLYLALWILVPREDVAEAGTAETVQTGAEEIASRARQMGEELQQNLRGANPRAGTAIGIALIILGAGLLIQTLGAQWLWWLDFDVLWPLLIILAGGVLAWRALKGG